MSSIDLCRARARARVRVYRGLVVGDHGMDAHESVRVRVRVEGLINSS